MCYWGERSISRENPANPPRNGLSGRSGRPTLKNVHWVFLVHERRGITPGAPRSIEPFGETSVIQEGLGLGGELAVQQITRDSQQRKSAVCRNFRISCSWSRRLPMRFSRPFQEFVEGFGAGRDEPVAARILQRPEHKTRLPQEILVVECEFFEAGPCHAGNLSSFFREVPEAWLPSAMFCTPLRAAWTI